MGKYCPKCQEKRNPNSDFCYKCGTPLKEPEPRKKIPKELRLKVYHRDGFRCKWCGASRSNGAELTIDHITPKALGGTDDIDNLQTLCKECNQDKAALIIDIDNLKKSWEGSNQDNTTTLNSNKLEIHIKSKQKELKLLNDLLVQEESKLDKDIDDDEKIDVLFNIKQLKEKFIPNVESDLKELTNKYEIELQNLKEQQELKEKQEKLFKKLHVYLDDSTLHILKRYFSINETSKEDIIRVLVEEHDEKEINNAIFEKFNNDLTDKQRYLSCYRFNNSKENFVNYLMENELSRDNLINELNSSRNKLFNELNKNLNNKQKYLLKMYFSLGECTDEVLINYLIDSYYTEKKLLKLLKSYQQQLFKELDFGLSNKQLKLIKIHYSINNYSREETIEFLVKKNIFTVDEVTEIIENSSTKVLVKNLDKIQTSLLRYKYRQFQTDEELYSFLIRKGYSMIHIFDLIESIKEKLYIRLNKELDYQKVYQLSRMLNVPNSKEKLIHHLIEHYTVDHIRRLIDI